MIAICCGRTVRIETGAGGSHGELAVTSLLLPGGPTPTLAYRFEAGGRAIVSSPVGWGREALVELARGASLLVHEGFFAESVELAIEVQPRFDYGRATHEMELTDDGAVFRSDQGSVARHRTSW